VSDALLADGIDSTTTDAATTPSGGVGTDTPPQTEEQKQAETTTDPAGTAKAEPPGEPKTEVKTKAPESYEFSVPEVLPEGYELDKAVTDEVATVARELDLSQEQAQSMLNTVLPVMHRRAEEQQTALNDQWQAETKADAEIGGLKLDETVKFADRAAKAYGSEGFGDLLKSPFGSHPEVVRFLMKVGRTVSEDETFVGGGSPGGSVDLNDDAAIAQVLFGKGT